MIAYLDASALVKRYLVERGSRETTEFTAKSEMTATSIVSRAEVAAALAKAARTGLVTHDVARNAQRSFAGDWRDLVRVAVTEALVERADTLHVVKMKPPEALAKRVIEAVEAGARMIYREDQSIRTHDFDLHRPPGTVAAVEVTSVTDGVVKAMYFWLFSETYGDDRYVVWRAGDNRRWQRFVLAGLPKEERLAVAEECEIAVPAAEFRRLGA